MSAPKTMRAYLIDGASGRVADGVAVPEIGANEVLLRAKAVAINPTDWKHCAYQQGPEGSILGCDVAGEVVKVGSDVSGVDVGDQCFTMVSGGSTERPGNGGFAEYVAADSRYLFKMDQQLDSAVESFIPAGRVTTLEGAASLPIALLTVAPTLGYLDKLKLEANSVGRNKYYLVWGGASSVGAIAIQFARFLGFRVIATCSARNSQLVESLGAERTFDYRAPDVVGQIKAYAGEKLEIAFDTISTAETMPLVNDTLPTIRPVNMDTTLDIDDKIKERKPNVTYGSHLGYLCQDDFKKFGVDAKPIYAPPGLHELSRELVKIINKLLNDPRANLRHMPCKILSNGFNSISEGLDIVRTAKNSGVKIVINNL
jgi:NADPH:quinone reductase-like Zn-dependent oxidoreductase